MEHAIGDKVVVAGYEEISKRLKEAGETILFFTEDMLPFCGKTLTIIGTRTARCGDHKTLYYRVKEDRGKHAWSDLMFALSGTPQQ